jgi:hypothetical protein
MRHTNVTGDLSSNKLLQGITSISNNKQTKGEQYSRITALSEPKQRMKGD